MGRLHTGLERQLAEALEALAVLRAENEHLIWDNTRLRSLVDVVLPAAAKAADELAARRAARIPQSAVV